MKHTCCTCVKKQSAQTAVITGQFDSPVYIVAPVAQVRKQVKEEAKIKKENNIPKTQKADKTFWILDLFPLSY